MSEFIALLLTTLVFIILDLFWFSWSLDAIYKPTFAAVQKSPLELRIAGGLVAWFLLAVGIRYFAIVGVADGNTNLQSLFTRGALLGAVVYGVYNGTNYATLKDYPISTAIADTMWGMFVVGTATLVSAQL
jgi:uncharacterized membrane protein